MQLLDSDISRIVIRLKYRKGILFFSKAAEDAVRQYLRFPKETVEESTTTKKKRGGTKP